VNLIHGEHRNRFEALMSATQRQPVVEELSDHADRAAAQVPTYRLTARRSLRALGGVK
jgi:hypothetical protein